MTVKIIVDANESEEIDFMIVDDFDEFYSKMLKAENVGAKYKNMTVDQFREWCSHPVSKFAFRTLTRIASEP